MKILTFDIEEWFHLLDNTSTKTEEHWQSYETRIHLNVERILVLLEKHNLKATFFCLGWIASRYPEVIRQIHSAGHEIGSHSHLHQLVYEQKPEDFKNDLERSIYALEDITGSKVTLYRSPGFSITKECFWAFEILLDHGIECDCSIFPAQRNHGGVSDFPIATPFVIDVNGRKLKELPMNMYRMGELKIPFSGGGYFRLLPYPIIRYMAAKDPYLMTYFHPRDFDKDQPMIRDLPTLRKVRSYYGLAGSYSKLDRFISEYKFLSASDAVKMIDWDRVPIHKIPC